MMRSASPAANSSLRYSCLSVALVGSVNLGWDPINRISCDLSPRPIIGRCRRAPCSLQDISVVATRVLVGCRAYHIARMIRQESPLDSPRGSVPPAGYCMLLSLVGAPFYVPLVSAFAL